MRRVCNVFLVLLVLGMLCAAGALAQPTDSPERLAAGYAGVPWGADMYDFHRARPGITIDSKSRNKEKFFGKDAEIIYLANAAGKWFGMVVYVSEHDKDDLELMFAHAFGRPKNNKAHWRMDDFWLGCMANGPIFIEGKVDGHLGGKE